MVSISTERAAKNGVLITNRTALETMRTINNPDRVCKQADGRTVYEKDFGRTVGSDPQGPVTKVRTVVEPNGEIVTSFPQRDWMNP